VTRGRTADFPRVRADTEHFQISRDFLNGRERFFKHLF
jgi:hypothetical protein